MSENVRAPFLPFDEDAAERTFNDKKECSPTAYRIGLDALAHIREWRERAERAEALLRHADERMGRMKPRLLDLFCGAGGAAVGYARAGFDVVGVDIEPQPNYPFFFMQGDALGVLTKLACGGWDLPQFDAVHASPPCQAWTAYKRTGNVGEYPDLIDATRRLLRLAYLPYVIENVYGAPLNDAVMICDSMFDPPQDLQRHRYFETNWPLKPPDWPCRHILNGPDRFPGGRSVERGGVSTAPVRRTIEIGSWDWPFADQKRAMGVDWNCTLEELSEMVPPRYTEFIGAQLLELVR